MPTWRTTARYQDVNSGLGWSITNWRNDGTAAAVVAAFNAWNLKYMNVCNTGVRGVDFRYSDEAFWRDVGVLDGASFTAPIGTLAVGLVPVAECALVKGIGPIPFLGTGYYHLHGIDVSILSPQGMVDGTSAPVLALSIASDLWFQQYRKVASPVHALPAVNPPAPWFLTKIEGPYVRKLGSPFNLPGQRARR